MKSPSPTSYYRATATPYPAWEPLQGSTHARVAVIGGGFAGLGFGEQWNGKPG